MRHVLYNFGARSGSDHTRNIGWGIFQNGWRQFLETRIFPHQSKDITWWIWNPFGRTSREKVMIFSQLSRSEHIGLLRQNWQLWREVSSPKVAYIGNPDNDASSEGVRQFSLEAIPYRDVGFEVALDAASSQLVGGESEQMLKLGLAEYVEATPKEDSAFWEYPAVLLHALFRKRHLHGSGGYPKATAYPHPIGVIYARGEPDQKYDNTYAIKRWNHEDNADLMPRQTRALRWFRGWR